jgi:hypothetical protein
MLVGRGGLEPPTSALTGPERCASPSPDLRNKERCSRFYVASPVGVHDLVRADGVLPRPRLTERRIIDPGSDGVDDSPLQDTVFAKHLLEPFKKSVPAKAGHR